MEINLPNTKIKADIDAEEGVEVEGTVESAAPGGDEGTVEIQIEKSPNSITVRG